MDTFRRGAERIGTQQRNHIFFSFQNFNVSPFTVTSISIGADRSAITMQTQISSMLFAFLSACFARISELCRQTFLF